MQTPPSRRSRALDRFKLFFCHKLAGLLTGGQVPARAGDIREFAGIVDEAVASILEELLPRLKPQEQHE